MDRYTEQHTKLGGKLTVLISDDMADDLRALRLATGQPTGDLIKQLIAAHLQTVGDDVEAGRAVLMRQRARQRSEDVAVSRASEGEGEEAEASRAMPDAAFIESWAKGENKPDKSEAQGKAFVAWCEAGGHEFGIRSFETYVSEVLATKFKPETVKTYAKFVKRLISAWGTRHELRE